jgi:glyoxylase-like metal-dependent hydrolase (beta-lactamase superfamily II)
MASLVRIEELCTDVMMFVGDAYESVATAFIDGNKALLIDTLGSEEDAHWLRAVLCDQMGLTVHLVATTHFMSDHMAGLTQFPGALVMAHPHHRHTFLSQNQPVAAFYREPDLVLDNMVLQWGRHQLHFLFNPGKTMDHFSIDVPTADLAFAGDNIVGNIVYLSKADPVLQRIAIGRIRTLGRSRIVGGHIGAFDARVLDNALHYLERIQQSVVSIRMHSPAAHVPHRIASIRIEDCVESHVEPTPFEREWHGHNLDVIVSQSIFTLDASLASMRSAA